MPLPKPPAKRADFLSREQFESQGAAAPGKSARRSRPAAEPVVPAVLELRNDDELPAAPPPPSLPAVTQPPAPTRGGHHAVRPEREKKAPRGNGPTTLFVLDTNVLMHDTTSLFRFEEHDIYLPMITLEELDGH